MSAPTLNHNTISPPSNPNAALTLSCSETRPARASIETRMLRADFHMHSTFSDGKLTVAEIVDHYGQREFDVIAITDHLCESEPFLGKMARVIGHTLTPENFPVYLETIRREAERAWDQYRMIVIPGFEISQNSLSNARSSHMLGLGVDRFIDADGDVYDIAKRIKSETGGVVVAAHPVNTRIMEKQTYHLWDRRREMRDVIDAWESTRYHHVLDEVAGSGLPVIANSDMHRPSHLRGWLTMLECERHPEAVLDAIRKQKIRFFFHDEAREQQQA